ncbi:MAG: hypothetical protein R3281_06875 [Balneolaceae bacterium]|nr:hypothetical protein [Balneolaceae bacterium]
MKSEYFSNQPAQIRGMREKQQESSVNWDRVVYLGLLAVVLGGLLFMILSYNFVLKGEGRVFVNHHLVKLPVDARIGDIFVREGEELAVGDSLFSYLETYQPESPGQLRDELRRLTEKILELDTDIKNKRAEIAYAENQLAYYESQKQLVSREIKMNLSTIRDYRDVERKIMELTAERDIDRGQLTELYRQRAQLQAWKDEAEQAKNGSAGLGSEVAEAGSEYGNTHTIFRSPVPGTVDRIDKTASELAIRSETILSIRKEMPEIIIQIIFPRSSLEKLREGDTMDIEFDNGVQSSGVISGFFTPQISNWDVVGIAEYDLNDYVVLRLKPVDKAEEQRWKKHSHLGVTVSRVVF